MGHYINSAIELIQNLIWFMRYLFLCAIPTTDICAQIVYTTRNSIRLTTAYHTIDYDCASGRAIQCWLINMGEMCRCEWKQREEYGVNRDNPDEDLFEWLEMLKRKQWKMK